MCAKWELDWEGVRERGDDEGMKIRNEENRNQEEACLFAGGGMRKDHDAVSENPQAS